MFPKVLSGKGSSVRPVSLLAAQALQLHDLGVNREKGVGREK